MKFRPIGERVLVKPKQKEEKTESGIYIPESAQEQNNEGEVVALGTGKDMPVAVGDYILFEKYSGKEITVDGDSYLILSTKDIMGVLER